MPPTRSNAAQAEDRRVERARSGGGEGRLATAVADFFLDPAERLSEQERALMTAMLHGLVALLADEVRVRLPDALSVATECPPEELVDELSRSGLLARPALIWLLLRRAEVLRVAQIMGQTGNELLQQWAADDEPLIAAAAMAVVLGRAAARDRFGRPGLELGDCDAETAVELTYAVAAAMGRRSPGEDDQFVAAAVDLLGRHDEGQRLDALEVRLVLALEQAGRLDSATLLALAARGEAGLLAEALGRIAGIPGERAWDLLIVPDRGRLALLLRMAGQTRPTSAALFASLGLALGVRDLAAEIEAFDRIGEPQAVAEKTRLRLPPAYQAATAVLGVR